MRAPGMTWFRMPLFIWSMYATSLVMILGTPVIAITILLLAFERLARVGIFDPAIGGDPVLFQHLFWFYSHPAVYIMVLPSMGVVSELIANFSRKNIFGYSFVAFSSLAIAVFGFLVWGHHLFVSGQSVYAGMIFSFLSFAVAIPSAIKVFNWTATLYKGSISFDTPLLYGLGFIGLFTIGGMTGLSLASLGVNVNAVAPGYVSTETTRPLREDANRELSIRSRIPAGRWADPEDIGTAVAFLASPAARYIHGHLLVVDGGWMGR
jgi:cytochrome c oxidase subunit 1